MGRDRKYQAILSAQRQNLNVEKRATTKCSARGNSRHHHALGTGIARTISTPASCAIKIILMTDADVTAAHSHLAAYFFLSPHEEFESNAATFTSRNPALSREARQDGALHSRRKPISPTN